jgi:hypothetical protein
MNPYPALGLAADVIKFLDFGSKLLSDARDIRNSAKGMSAEHADLDAITANLSELCSNLAGTEPPSYRSSADEKAIHTLARSAKDIGDELRSSLQRVQRPNARNSHLSSVRQSLQWILNRDVGRLRARLDEIRSQLSMHLIAYTR